MDYTENMTFCYSILADILVFIHFLYVVFVVFGELCILLFAPFGHQWVRNRCFRILHLSAIAVVAILAIRGAACPLTQWEYMLRDAAGQVSERDLSFMARLLRSVIFYTFPDYVFRFLHVGFGLLVILTVFLVPPRWTKQE